MVPVKAASPYWLVSWCTGQFLIDVCGGGYFFHKNCTNLDGKHHNDKSLQSCFRGFLQDQFHAVLCLNRAVGWSLICLFDRPPRFYAPWIQPCLPWTRAVFPFRQKRKGRFFYLVMSATGLPGFHSNAHADLPHQWRPRGQEVELEVTISLPCDDCIPAAVGWASILTLGQRLVICFWRCSIIQTFLVLSTSSRKDNYAYVPTE